ncbi:MAG TPA: SDR family NAD(P)-dependent oxidoreductase [Dehalococcoidia bacterium]|nr:SDR family NAD(P)-dependent oxidoreductase [Dehalococcoidia bacterium]
MRLQGQNAIITGGAQGIGRATAIAFAQEGANVALLDINGPGAEKIAAEAASHGVKAITVSCDVTREPEVEAAIAKAVAGLGGLDILVNTAAWLDPPIPVAEMPFDVWDRAITTDLTSVFLCSKHALRVMQPNGKGRVISLSSGAGKRGRAGRASYGAAKAAIINLTESMAYENAQHGITVNCICPGAVAGDRALNIYRQLAEAQGRSSEEGETEYRKLEPRFVTEEEVAGLAVFLASDEGARINGQAISIG